MVDLGLKTLLHEPAALAEAWARVREAGADVDFSMRERKRAQQLWNSNVVKATSSAGVARCKKFPIVSGRARSSRSTVAPGRYARPARKNRAHGAVAARAGQRVEVELAP